MVWHVVVFDKDSSVIWSLVNQDRISLICFTIDIAGTVTSINHPHHNANRHVVDAPGSMTAQWNPWLCLLPEAEHYKLQNNAPLCVLCSHWGTDPYCVSQSTHQPAEIMADTSAVYSCVSDLWKLWSSLTHLVDQCDPFRCGMPLW